jgi:hypothetical protein
MIIKNKDIDEFESALEQLTDYTQFQDYEFGAIYEGHEQELQLNNWLANNPQVFMAGAKLQEFVDSHDLNLCKKLVREGIILGMPRPAFRKFTGEWFAADYRGTDGIYGYNLESLDNISNHEEEIEDYDDKLDEAISCVGMPDELIKEAKRYVDNPLVEPISFVSPKLWTPESQRKEKQLIQNVATPLLNAIIEEKLELGSIHWKELEAIVAEMLRESGMEIHSVREAPQGGRDIIARAQLLPNETLTIAVEVKHRDLVDRPELEKALYQNANYPALMLVTSGRFSAGVISEASKAENKMRIFLKDGVAIRDMIKHYGVKA